MLLFVFFFNNLLCLLQCFVFLFRLGFMKNLFQKMIMGIFMICFIFFQMLFTMCVFDNVVCLDPALLSEQFTSLIHFRV